MIHHELLPVCKTSYDTFIIREQNRILCKPYDTIKGKKILSTDKLVLRFLYKPASGVLWVFNRTCMSKQWFKEI